MKTTDFRWSASLFSCSRFPDCLPAGKHENRQHESLNSEIDCFPLREESFLFIPPSENVSPNCTSRAHPMAPGAIPGSSRSYPGPFPGLSRSSPKTLPSPLPTSSLPAQATQWRASNRQPAAPSLHSPASGVPESKEGVRRQAAEGS